MEYEEVQTSKGDSEQDSTELSTTTKPLNDSEISIDDNNTKTLEIKMIDGTTKTYQCDFDRTTPDDIIDNIFPESKQDDK